MNIFEGVYDYDEEWLSICCTANHDERFHFDEEYNMGICVKCKEHSEFSQCEDDDENKKTKEGE